MDHNITQIVLIPKTKAPTTIGDYRPISLCSVFMKIISIMLVNRIQLFMDQIISQNQSAFIKNRNISDNIIIAQEVSFFIRSCKNQWNGFASLKFDMSKAFERL